MVLTDRSPAEVLPALSDVGFDLKTEPLASQSIAHLDELSPSVVIVDAEENPDQGFRLLSERASGTSSFPAMAAIARSDLDRFAWHEVTDDFVFSGATASEIRTRLALLARKNDAADEGVHRLGPLSLNTDTFQVKASGRVLDLTYKEFELLRFLVQRPGRVFTRSALLQEVWGYDFYGGTRTVDVHVRRLRAKLGVEHEGLIETVRGVGYRAAEPRSDTGEG